MSMKSLRQRITTLNGIDIPDADYLRVPAGEIRAAIAEVAELRRERDEARRDRDMLRLCMNDAACRALVSERDQLAARLAEIERAASLDADIIEAQRAVVEQLASRPACDWPGKCKHQHQRPAPAAAPDRADHVEDVRGMVSERAEPADGCSDSTSRPRGVMTISVYYFCAEYRDDQLTHSMSGTIQSDMPPFHGDFHARLTERIAANMMPPRPAGLVSVRSLSLLATREVEHGDVWARQSGRDPRVPEGLT